LWVSKDGLDPLADPAGRAAAGNLVAAVGADQAQPETVSDPLLELAPGEALVADQDQAGAQRVIAAGVGEQGGSYLAFPDLRAGQAPGHRHSVRGGDHV
jgi:hypothetical protein